MKEFAMMVGAVVVGALVVDLLAGLGWTPGEMIAERNPTPGENA